MHRHVQHLLVLAGLIAMSGLAMGGQPATEPPAVGFETRAGSVAITVGGQPMAIYVYEDPKILRPYFANVRAPGGTQVTRNQPPLKGVDRTDHADMHPGIWMAFGDLDGSDFWRNRGRVVHERFVENPTGGPGKGTLAVRNRYVAVSDGEPQRTVCREVCRYGLYVRPSGYLLVWDSTFSAVDQPFAFGDQEEMGVGVRVATPISVLSGGRMVDAEGRRNEKEIWGHASAWCDYSGAIGPSRVGATIFCHPGNFRSTWFHARDYGVLVANVFGRKAFHQGPSSKVVVRPGEQLRLRYGILLHAGPMTGESDLRAAYADYLQLAGE